MKRFSIAVLILLLPGANLFAEEAEVSNTKEAVFAGGCFWCMEPPFDAQPGVLETEAGYTGGWVENPSYEEVSVGNTGHFEAIRITYDPEQVSYDRLLEIFWRNIDPTDALGQFADKGSQYRTAVFFHDEAQKASAYASKRALEASGTFREPIVTEILPAGPFYPAEDDHQDYYQKEPKHYNLYKKGSGREGFIKKKWGE